MLTKGQANAAMAAGMSFQEYEKSLQVVEIEDKKLTERELIMQELSDRGVEFKKNESTKNLKLKLGE